MIFQSLLINNHVMPLLKRTFQIINANAHGISRLNRRCDKFWFSTASKPIERMTELLKLKFPQAKNVEVVDVSGGCGAMYEVYVESIEFKGLSIVKQHRLINEILKDDIKQMHGLRILTKIPEEKG